MEETATGIQQIADSANVVRNPLFQHHRLLNEAMKLYNKLLLKWS